MEINNGSGFTQFAKPCELPFNLTEDQLSFHQEYTWWIEVCGSIIVGFVGIGCNVTTIFVVLGSKLSANFFNWLLIFLMIFDTNFLFIGILEALRKHVGGSNVLDQLFVYVLHYYRSVILFCSEYMTILLALERYQAMTNSYLISRCNYLNKIRYNLRRYFSLHRCRLAKYVGPIMIFALIFYIPKLFELKIEYHDVCFDSATNSNSNAPKPTCEHREIVVHTQLRIDDSYVLWYLNVTNKLITIVIPIISLIYLNFNIFLSLKHHVTQSRERQESREECETNLNEVDLEKERRIERKERNLFQQTLMLFAIVILFLISHSPRIILNFEEWVYLKNAKEALKNGCVWVQYWTLLLIPVSHLLLQLNCSSSLFVYCLFNTLFRDTIRGRLSRSTDI